MIRNRYVNMSHQVSSWH